MKLIRNGLVAVAVAASMVVPATAAHAAPSTLKVTSFTGAGSQGWAIDDVDGTKDDAFPYKFVAGNNPPLGSGSLQYAATKPTIDFEKMYFWRTESISVADFRKVKFDYYFAPDSAVKTPSQIYLNIYVNTVATTVEPTFYDCKFDYVATRAADGKWSTLAMDRADAPTTPPTARNGAVCGSSIAQLQPNDKITRIAINAGDSGASDAGMKGGFDNVFVKTKTSEITYDFEPATVTPPTPVKACTQSLPLVEGTTRNDLKNGTDAAQRIELKAGNDISDAKGGADCVIGGDGNDQLTGGPGDDEIQAGAGNDIINVKNDGADTVDCGSGSDIVFADDKDDVAGNCETVQPRR